jgi:site-specific DNA-methyltransferase (adenine-specific)
MNEIPDKSIDMILCDLPYGTTKCSWDIKIPFEALWKQYSRIVKNNGAIVLFGSEPFSSHLRISNISDYKYDIYWKKEKPTNFFQLKKRVGKSTECISVFYKEQPTYNPQMEKYNGKAVTNKPKGIHASIVAGDSKQRVTPYIDTGYRYPCDVLEIRREKLGTTIHPTQKPVALCEWLIKTFTNEREIILDNCMGSGSTAIAAINTNRQFIGFELDATYYNLAKNRINQHIIDLNMQDTYTLIA